MPVIIGEVIIDLIEPPPAPTPPLAATGPSARDEQQLLQILTLLRQRQDRLKVD